MSEIALFRAVVLRALSDATKPDRVGRDALQERSRAREWLLSGSRDFRDVCRFAELDPDYISDKAKALAAAGWPTLDLAVSREKIAQAA
jgi:hypothetical protein